MTLLSSAPAGGQLGNSPATGARPAWLAALRAAAAPHHLLALWALAALLLSLAGLGAAPLFDVDEGAFSEATRELLASGDWGHTTLNGADRFDKPILVYWLQAASVSLLGLDEFALRLPSALCSWGWALALALFATPRWGMRAGVMAGTLVLTSLGVVLIGRAATADALLNLLITLATLDLWRHLEHGTRAPLRRAGLWIGLGLLAKGPVALLVPGAAVLLWCLAGREWCRLRGVLTDLPAWALLLGSALPWYVYALQRHGWAFIDGFVVRHNLARYSGPLEGHAGSPIYYLLMLPLLLWPWAPLLVLLATRARRLWAEPLARYLLLWASFVLLFFSFSGTKLPHYLLYGCTPLWLLASRFWLGGDEAPAAGSAAAGPSQRLPRWLMPLLIGGLLAELLVPALLASELPALAGQIDNPLYRALLAEPTASISQVLTALGGSALVVWLMLCPTGARLLSLRLPLAAALVTLVLVTLIVPWWAERLQSPVRQLALRARAERTTVVQWGLHQPSFAFYLQRVTPLRAPTAGEVALVRLDRLAPAGSPPAWKLLTSERGYGLLRWQAEAAPSGALQ